MASALPPATPENAYRIKRLNQWVVSATSWLPHGAWESCASPERVVGPGERVVLGFDGSWTNDSTALVGCTLSDHHLFVIAVWERPLEAVTWVVPSGEVETALLEAVGTYEVIEIACDPHYWREQLLRWDDLGLPVTEWPTNVVSRMVPACREFHTAVVEQRLGHEGDPRLARHIANATVRTDQAGARIVKSSRGQKIDLAVAAVIAYDRGTWDCEFVDLGVGVGDVTFGESVLTCAGAEEYEGLTAVVRVDWTVEPVPFEALVFGGEVPPVPDVPDAE